MDLEDLIGATNLEEDAPQVGSTLGHYLIQKLIAPTKHGWVFLAEDSKLARKVAIKVLSKEVEESRRKQFHEEGERQAKLEKHQGVVTVYAAEEQQGYNCLVMEHIEGETLAKKLERDRVTIQGAREMIKSITASLSFCHERGIYHGDVKPSNIIEKEDKQLVLIDFGSKLSLGDISKDSLEMEKVDLKGTYDTISTILKSLEKNEKIPKNLERIICRTDDEIKNNKFKYEAVGELDKALLLYNKRMKRRKFLEILGVGVAGIISLSTIGKYFHFRHQERIRLEKYKNSAAYIVEQIKKIDSNNENIEQERGLRKELLYRLFDQKIRFVAKEKIKPGEYPMGSNKNDWFTTTQPLYSNGFWPGILIEGSKIIKDEEFASLTRKWMDPIAIRQEDSKGITGVRFFYSHAAFYDATREEKSRLNALQVADFFVDRFDYSAPT